MELREIAWRGRSLISTMALLVTGLCVRRSVRFGWVAVNAMERLECRVTRNTDRAARFAPEGPARGAEQLRRTGRWVAETVRWWIVEWTSARFQPLWNDEATLELECQQSTE